MRRTLVILTALVATTLAVTALLAPSAFAQTSQPEAIYRSYLVQVIRPAGPNAPAETSVPEQILALVNAERARVPNCPALTLNTRLNASAQAHSEDMARQNYFSHTGLDGSDPWDRMERAGYNWTRAGENIAAGQDTPEEVMQGWMNSTGHRANILNCNFTELGVGYVFEEGDTFPGPGGYGHYWTQNFGRQ